MHGMQGQQTAMGRTDLHLEVLLDEHEVVRRLPLRNGRLDLRVCLLGDKGGG